MCDECAKCPECGKVFHKGETVARCQHKGVDGCNVCSYKDKDESVFVPLIILNPNKEKIK